MTIFYLKSMPKVKNDETKKKTSRSEDSKKKDSQVEDLKKPKSQTKKAKQDPEYEKELQLFRKELEKNQKEEDDLGEYTFDEEEEEDDEENILEYNKLTDEEERQKIKKNMAKAHAFLEKFDIQDMEIDSQNHIIVVPFEYENLQFLSHVIIGAEWYIVKTSIFELDESTKKIENELFFELLKGNFLLNDVTYSIDPDRKSIWCEADIPANCTFKQFKLHYFSIVFAIDYFIKNISNNIKAPIQSTYHSEKSNEDMYI